MEDLNNNAVKIDDATVLNDGQSVVATATLDPELWAPERVQKIMLDEINDAISKKERAQRNLMIGLAGVGTAALAAGLFVGGYFLVKKIAGKNEDADDNDELDDFEDDDEEYYDDGLIEDDEEVDAGEAEVVDIKDKKDKKKK